MYNLFQSFRYAFSGIWHTLKSQRNAQIHLLISLAVLLLGWVVKLSRVEWAILALTIGFVITLEMLNTVVEAAMDYATAEFHPQVKIIKDVAAGAVLLGAIVAVIIGLLILAPPLFALLLSGS